MRESWNRRIPGGMSVQHVHIVAMLQAMSISNVVFRNETGVLPDHASVRRSIDTLTVSPWRAISGGRDLAIITSRATAVPPGCPRQSTPPARP